MRAYDKYMQVHSDLVTAIDKYVVESYATNLSEKRIASDILDIVYDYNKNLYAEMQEQLLPMVKEFEGSKSLQGNKVSEDWQRLKDEWGKKQMWRIISK